VLRRKAIGAEALASQRDALDPIPEIGPYGPHDLVSLSREEFLGLLAAGR
jgi:hypothetical protein